MKKITLFFVALFITSVSFGQMSGTYQVGTGQTYETLKAACDAINSTGVGGDIVLEITSDLTEASNVALGVSTNSYSITIKPAASTTPTIEFTDGTTSQSIDGHFVIGSPDFLNTNLIPTNSIIIDGSNTSGGTTKDLTLLGPVTTSQRSVVRIYGNNDNITIKNCIITDRSSSGSSTAPIMLTDYSSSSPDNFTALNNTLTASSGNGGVGIQFSNSGTPTVLMSGAKVQNNIITARATRAILFNYVADGEISGNTITHDCQLGTGAAATIAMMTGGTGVSGTFDVFNNQILQCKTWSSSTSASASNGIIAIDNQLSSPKIVNIYNNFITGFTVASASVQSVKIYGIRHGGASTSYIYNNTIVVPEMTDMTTTTNSYIAGIAFASIATSESSPSGVSTVKNNIIISNETTMPVYGIRRVGTTGTFTSDYNNIYAATSNNNVGFYDASDAPALSDWQTASSQDSHSVSKAVNFVSVNDLSLTGSSINDPDLAAPAIGSPVTTDIFGNSRYSPKVYMGAHEPSDINSVLTNINNEAEPNTRIMRTYSGIAAIFDGSASVELYSINGTLIDRVKANGSYSRDLEHGIYIIRINGKAIKFVR